MCHKIPAQTNPSVWSFVVVSPWYQTSNSTTAIPRSTHWMKLFGITVLNKCQSLQSIYYQAKMYGHTLSLGAFASLLVSTSGAEYSVPGFCTNPWRTGLHSSALSNTCWIRGEPKAYHLQTRVSEIAPSNNFTARLDAPTYPWTQHPICTATTPPFCVYTKSDFFSGRGISIIGTAESVHLISRNRVFHQPSPPSRNQDANLKYEVRQLPGRGLGLLANRALIIGDEIMAHPPAIVVQAMASEILAGKELWELFRVGVAQLPLETRNMFLALQGDAGGDDVYDRFTTNAFELFDYAAVFPETAVSF
jgi:hypothetical protein